MNWNELESRFYQTFAESIDTDACIVEFGEARAFYGLTQVLARAARGKMPEKSAVNYAVGIMRHCTEKEASAAFRKEVRISLQDEGWWIALKERVRGLTLAGTSEIQIPYLDTVRTVPVQQIEEVMNQYVNQKLDRPWQHWFMVVTYHLLLSHLYTPEGIAIRCAREYREFLPEVEAHYRKEI